MPGIYWLASYPKSGNTWIRIFLANVILNQKTPLSINETESVCPSEASVMWFQPIVDKPVEELSEEDIAKIRRQAQERAVSLNKNIIPMKTHSYMGLNLGHAIFSMKATIGAVYIIRDPRDIVLSFADHFGKNVDAAIGYLNREKLQMTTTEGEPVVNVHEFISTWSHHVASWTVSRHPRFLVIRYEDLKENTQELFRKICHHMGITRDEERIERAIRFSSFKCLQKQEEKEGFKEKSSHSNVFFRKGRSGVWKDVLTPEQVARIVKDHEKMMRRFGYL